jgi:hypothetical protein
MNWIQPKISGGPTITHNTAVSTVQAVRPRGPPQNIESGEMPPKDELTEGEMEVVTVVFKQYEKGLREAAINSKVSNEM